MNILEEYEKQQRWRNWGQYLQHVPIRADDHVIDLGCSVGGVSNWLSKHAERVTGIDLNRDLIEYCQVRKKAHQTFICENFEKINYDSIGPITGIWSSFSLSYLENPVEFLSGLHKALESGGWVALVDVSCFLSGNMPQNGMYHDSVKEFEMNSWESGQYDFDFGSKMETVLKWAGFSIFYVDNDVTDSELNSTGPASSEVLANWKARLERMRGLRMRFPSTYTEVCQEIMLYLGSTARCKRNNVRFVVGRKT